MIVGLGTDIVRCDRFSTWFAKPIMARYFHPSEVAYILQRGSSALQSMAARFAAKEALGKALGTGLTGIRLRDIEVAKDSSGRPFLQLHGTAQAALAQRGELQMWLSLAHEVDHAVATVILEHKGVA